MTHRSQLRHLPLSAVLLAAGLLALIWATPSSAAPMIDQSHIITQSVGGLITVSDFTPAQTFTVGLAGALAKVDVQIGRDAAATNDLMFEIWSTTGGAPTGGAPLFTTTIPASAVPVAGPSTSLPFTSVDVTNANLIVAAGQMYAVAVRGTPDFDEPHAFWNWGYPGYSAGNPYSTAFGQPWESEANDVDFGFRTWVDPNPAATQTVELTPLFDAAAELVSGIGFVVTDGGNSIPIDRVPHLERDERGVLEFDLSSIPSNATIVGASLQFDINQRTEAPGEFPIVELYGYAGDGQLQPADANDISNLLGASAPIDSFDTIDIDLDAAALADLWFASDYLGLVAYQRIPPHRVHMVSSELAEQVSSYVAPTLTITFETPPVQPNRPGDYNGNGIADAADYVLWRHTLGQSGDDLAADGDGNGSVGPEDYAVWRSAFGVQPPTGVRNGDFATGDLSEWDVVIEPNTDVSVGFPRVEMFDVDGDGATSEAMRIRLARINPSLNEGGKAGIEQEILVTDPGDYVLSADFAAASFQSFGNTAPGRFELLFDNTLVDFVDLNGTVIDGFQVIRDSLEAQLLDVAAGSHTVRLLVHRPGTNSREIYEYYDNIVLAPLAAAVTSAIPEPATVSLAVITFGIAAVCKRPRPSAG